MRKTSWIGWVFIVLLFLLAGCGGGSSSQSYLPLGTVTAVVTDDWGTLSGGEVPAGCTVINNVWNKVHAASGPSFQKIFLEDINGEKAFGWNWQWPTGPDVVTYPEVVFGTKPWDMGDQSYSLGGATPFKAGSKTVTANFDIRLQASGQYNMAFSLWATADPSTPKASISHEIMIWNVNHGNTPAGTHQGTVTVDGTIFDVYVNPNQEDHSGGATITWTYIAFVARQSITSGPLHLSDFITYLLDQSILSTDSYITSVELGNEIIGGNGLVEIRNYSIDIQ